MTRAEDKANDAWAIYEYREHPKGLYHTCFVDGYKEGYEQAEKDLKEALTEYINKELAKNKGWKDTCWHDRYSGWYGVALENVLENLKEL